jgi:hypothetical protein
VPEHPRTAPARELPPASPADPPGGAGALLVDSHVHLHPCFDLGSVLDHADRNFTRASRQVGAGRWIGALLLAEIEGVDRFRELLELADLQGSVDAWSLEQGEDGASIVARSDAGHTMVVVAGRQLRVEHRLEVLALCTAKHFPEGHSLAVTARMVREGGGVPVIPWGFGKVVGEAGKPSRPHHSPGGKGLLPPRGLGPAPRGCVSPDSLRSGTAAGNRVRCRE